MRNLVLSLLLLACPLNASAHPLDALSADEMNHTTAALKAGRQLTSGKIVSITLVEPPKADVLRWTADQKLTRRAQVRALQKKQAYEGIVNLDTGTVERWDAVPGKQPSFLMNEFFGAVDAVKADKGWRAAMARRGYTRYDSILCNPLAVGYLPDAKERSLRLMNVPCFDATGARNNIYARPVEGLMAVVDLNSRKVLRLLDPCP